MIRIDNFDIPKELILGLNSKLTAPDSELTAQDVVAFASTSKDIHALHQAFYESIPENVFFRSYYTKLHSNSLYPKIFNHKSQFLLPLLCPEPGYDTVKKVFGLLHTFFPMCEPNVSEASFRTFYLASNSIKKSLVELSRAYASPSEKDKAVMKQSIKKWLDNAISNMEKRVAELDCLLMQLGTTWYLPDDELYFTGMLTKIKEEEDDLPVTYTMRRAAYVEYYNLKEEKRTLQWERHELDEKAENLDREVAAEFEMHSGFFVELATDVTLQNINWIHYRIHQYVDR